MAESILCRLLSNHIVKAENVLISEPQSQRRFFLQQEYKVNVTGDNCLAFSSAEVLLLAIKPQIFDVIAEQLKDEIDLYTNVLIISILAGVNLERLESVFCNQPVIRSMPNTPSLVGAGMTAITRGNKVSDDHFILASSIFSAIGEVLEVNESLMNGVTALSGSGPAFVAIMMEALADGGVASGLPRAIANQLALQTVLGTAQLLKEKSLHPAQLKDQVTSPGGTTIAGVAQLEKSAFRSAIIEAVKAAYHRSQELG